MKFLKLAYFLILSCGAIHHAAADSLIANSGFEEGILSWGIFIPDESKTQNCRFDVVSDSPHSGVNCARLQSDDFARFSVGTALIPVQAGEHYHVSVWVKADAAAQVLPKTPGIVIRLYLRQGTGDADGGHLFIALGNQVTRNTPVDPAAVTLPTTWTQIEAVVEVPPGVDAMGPSLFSWRCKGIIYVDDFTLEKVDATTAVTPMGQGTSSPSPAPAPK